MGRKRIVGRDNEVIADASACAKEDYEAIGYEASGNGVTGYEASGGGVTGYEASGGGVSVNGVRINRYSGTWYWEVWKEVKVVRGVGYVK